MQSIGGGISPTDSLRGQIILGDCNILQGGPRATPNDINPLTEKSASDWVKAHGCTVPTSDRLHSALQDITSGIDPWTHKPTVYQQGGQS